MKSGGEILRTKLIRDIRTQKGLFIATTFILFLGVTIFCSFYLSYLNLHDTYESFYESSDFEDISVRAVEIRNEDLERIKKIDGVLEVQPRIAVHGSVYVNGRNIPALVISLPENERINRLYIAEGEKGFAVLKKFADYHGLTTNTPLVVNFGGVKYTNRISALVYSPEFILIFEEGGETFTPSPGSYAIVYVPEDDMVSAGMKYSEVKVRVADEDKKEEVLRKILAVLGERVEEFHTDETQVSRRLLKEDLDGFQALSVMFPAFFMLIAIFSTYALLSRIVRLQMGNIAILRAIGFTRKEILSHYLHYPLLIGFFASITGVIAGFIGSCILTTEYVNFLNLPYFVSKPHLEIYAASIIVGTATPLLSGLVVAFQASRVDIVKALRGYVEETFSEGLTVKFDAIISRILRIRLIFRTALRNLVRNRKRTAISLFSIVACTSLILNSMVFVDSFDYVMQLQFGKVYAYDIKVSLDGYDEKQLLEEIRRMDGVLLTEPLVETSIAVEKGGSVASTLLIASNYQNLYNVYNADGEKIVPGKGIIFSKTSMKNLSLVKGEKVSIYTEFGKLKAEVGGLELIPLLSVATTSLDYFKEISGVDGFNTIVVDADDSRIGEIAEKIREMDGVRKVSTIQEAEKSIGELMGFFYAFITFSLMFGASLGFAAIFNTTSISVIERSREFATLRMLGYTPREITLSLIFESVFIGILGLAIGLPVAYATAYAFFTSFESELYYLPMLIFPRTYAFTVAAVFVVVLTALFPSTKHISKMDIAKVTKEVVS
ncbi:MULTISPECIES: ABC transporter permease [unclassified Archaeoglobus]|jgi:putative ABC transport system permease protein|uniref:ABC transporter permease n=1 Tax=unclassified Archaeoglobus TaxID=2643606 RepID=UPI0025C73676|nr:MULTISPECIES: ABC transporter permease [unclassified Archaeoglobus]